MIPVFQLYTSIEGNPPSSPCSLNSLLLAGYDDYMSYLCGINGSAPMVLNYTGLSCHSYNTSIAGSDLNLPSITIATLHGSRTIQRTVTNIAGNETFTVGWSAPYGVSMTVTPSRFFIPGGQKQVIFAWFNVTMNSSTVSFGRIGLFGDQGHIVNIPLSIIIRSVN